MWIFSSLQMTRAIPPIELLYFHYQYFKILNIPFMLKFTALLSYYWDLPYYVLVKIFMFPFYKLLQKCSNNMCALAAQCYSYVRNWIFNKSITRCEACITECIKISSLLMLHFIPLYWWNIHWWTQWLATFFTVRTQVYTYGCPNFLN